MTKGKDSFYGRYIKRLLDILFAMVVLVLFCWIYAILSLLVRIKMGSPVFYTAQRPGMVDPKTGKECVFHLYKYRSMTNARDADGVLLPDSQRLTKFGRLLRATSLDELPEVINILKGDMSFVGPRPLAISYLDYYTKEEHRRHTVRPGLTGLAQINGRNTITWEQKFSYDIYYVDNLSFSLDIRIIVRTIIKVFHREGIGQGEAAPISLSVERKTHTED